MKNIVQSVAAILKSIPAASSSQIRDVYISSIVHVLHSIWLARNGIRFGGCKLSLIMAQNSIIASVSLSGSISNGYCVPADTPLLDKFHIPPSFRRFKEIIPVVWKAPTVGWVKVNMDGSVTNSSASCGGIFRDHLGTFMGCFACNLGAATVVEAKLTAIIIALEFAATNNWRDIWVESDSSAAVLAFKNSDLFPFCLRNRWHNCRIGIRAVCSYIYREGNCCADLLAAFKNSLTDTVWFDRLPSLLAFDFARDRNSLPNYRFP